MVLPTQSGDTIRWQRKPWLQGGARNELDYRRGGCHIRRVAWVREERSGVSHNVERYGGCW